MRSPFAVFFSIIVFLFAVHSLAASDLFWEEAAPFTPRQGRFPVHAYSNNISAIAWQEVTLNTNPQIAAAGFIYIFLAVKDADGWHHRGAVAGPYPFAGAEPSIIDLVIDRNDRILITAAVGSGEAEISISHNRGISFEQRTISLGEENSVAPRIFVRADGGYLLFVTRGSALVLSIYFSRSDNGIDWSPFEFFTPESAFSLNFLPTHAAIGSRDIVFFQSLTMGIDDISNFQLYFKISQNGGRTWTNARRFTTFNNPVGQRQAAPESFDNQRPHLTRYGNNLLIVWERRYSNQAPSIYSAIINAEGNLAGDVERVNTVDAYCQNPIGFIHNGEPAVTWFDNRLGHNRVVLATRGPFGWQNQLPGAAIEAAFVRPVVCPNDGMFLFWQARVQNADRIFVLAPDHSVASPILAALNFTPGVVNRGDVVRVSWNVPHDTSGVSGFSWSWSQNPNVVPPEQVTIFNIGGAAISHEVHANIDGLWYFSVRTQDNAGNWSAPARITYHRKTAPPPPLAINDMEIDEHGYLISNTFSVLWQPSTDPFLAGYTWNLQLLGASANGVHDIAPPPLALPARIMGTNTSVNFFNQDNGLWAFSVAAIDQAGNIGLPSNVVFRTNRFIPYTNISFVDAHQDEQGVLSIRLHGRGFTTNGRITSVVLEYNGMEYRTEQFTIVSDREIRGIVFENINEGNYRLSIEHSGRGWFTAAPFVSTARAGTVKFGDFSQQWRTSWRVQPLGRITFNPIMALGAIMVIFSALGVVAILRGIGGIVTESMIVKQELLAIITGDFMPAEKKQRMLKAEKKGRGLSFKLTSFTAALILLVVIMISIPMYTIMTNTQRRTLLESLHDRSNVLLESVAANVRTHMPIAINTMGESGIPDILLLPLQYAAIPEANYLTIIGSGIGSIHTNHVWASNDPDILLKLDTVELNHGFSRFTGELTDYLEGIGQDLNVRAQQEAGELSGAIGDLTQQIAAIPFTEANMPRIMAIQETVNSYNQRVAEVLAETIGEIGSIPRFSTDRIDIYGEPNFIFYKPIMYRQTGDDNFFRGFVIMEVSIDSIREEIRQAQWAILTITGSVGLIAMIIGMIGAFTLAKLIVMPLRKLVSHIQMVHATEDKTKLAGVEIKISSKDEIALLGNSINGMTQGLVKAALAASDLSIGKEIQKKFIPLDMDSHGNKKTSGSKQTPNLNFFGYYEGAKGVSGDYFDFVDLDGRYYAIIKCDVAGKGIPAALIMIQVATMFVTYFKQWKPNAKGMQIQEVVYQINDFIETLGFKGRFAAFALCLYDSQTGVARFCNAGDNIITFYDASEKCVKTVTLPTTPATGVLPNFLIEQSNSYKVQTLTFDKDDILLLFTDGIEEAKRKFRNSEFKEIVCTEGDVDTPHGNHLCGQADEEMTPERVKDIINAVMAKEVYTLQKYHNPEGDNDLQFDFSSCEGTVEELIMAMVSVEKIFRMYKPAKANEDHRVLVDKKVDEFLKNHFLQYRRYCAYTRENHENNDYMYYTHVMEDEQYDDLTILGIKRK